MTRKRKLARQARKWKIIGGLALLSGVFLLYQKVYYETRDFYSENFELYQEHMAPIALDATDKALLDQAMLEMKAERFWEATTLLEKLKEHNPSATQIAEWYKILCMIGLDEKATASDLLEYYTEQVDFDFNRQKALDLSREY